MEHDITELISQLSIRVRTYNAARKEEKSEEGFSDREILFLEYLGTKEAVRYSQMKMLFRDYVTGPTFSNTLKRMHKDSFIERSPDPDDYRNIWLALSPKGKKAFLKLKQRKMPTFELIEKSLELEDQDIKVLRKVIPKAIDNIEAYLKMLSECPQKEERSRSKGASDD